MEVKVNYFHFSYELVKMAKHEKNFFQLQSKFKIRSAIIRYFQLIAVKHEAFFRKKPPEPLCFEEENPRCNELLLLIWGTGNRGHGKSCLYFPRHKTSIGKSDCWLYFQSSPKSQA